MKTWKRFAHVNAKTIDEASSILRGGKAALISGGTDLLGTMRFEILPDYPEVLVNLKTVPGLDYVKEEGGMLRIGALTRLEDIVRNDTIRNKYAALAEAAHRTATPHIREMGTLAGNICQFNRCWYFRNPDNRFNCIRKGGKQCFAMMGDNRYHSIFGAVKMCLAVNPSDTAPALVALNAKIKTNKRLIEAEQFWEMTVPGSTVLAADEIVTEIQIPTPGAGVKSAFIKFAIRKSIDFPIVNCAAMVGGGQARVCLNAVYNKPYRATAAEEAIKGKAINEDNADAAGAAAVAAAKALPGDRNKWKIPIAKTMVKRAILACA
ncbi:MAG: molybdopterin dehydrogenase FAD-binding protein [Acidobacteria bacterium]|nr:molybdopterin dehydrogenase FAD-binding protein [Acidobacteriota bacterium]